MAGESKRKRRFDKYVISTIFVLIILYIYFSIESQEVSTNYVYLEKGWNVSGDINFENADLSTLIFDQVKRGDEICFSSVIKDFDITEPALVFYTIHAAYRVCLDGQEIAEYGYDRVYIPNKLVGYGYQMVSLPSDCAGKTLNIYLTVSEDNAFTNFRAPFICDGSKFVKDLIIERIMPLLINIFLFVMGFIIFVISLFFGFRSRRFFKLSCIGAFSFVISAWSLCNYDLIFIFTYNPLIKAYVEFAALYFCGIPLILYFWDEIHEKEKNWISVLYYVSFAAQIIFDVVATFLQFTGLLSFPNLLAVQHGILLVLAVFMVSTCILDLLSRTYHHIALAFGTAIVILVGVADILRFNIEKYIVAFQGVNYTSLICVGTLMFIICQLIDYYKSLERDLIQLARTDALEKLAYIDELTGLYNRRKSEEEMDSIDITKEDCGIFSFDLNNLKTMNDSFGHEKGDELLKAFANVLRNTFDDNALVVRTGGDEFIAICRNSDENTRKYYTDRLYKYMDEESDILGIKISVAIGYSHTRDARNVDLKATLRRADARMYKNKNQMKQDNK